jgi:hypothetical protein
MAEKAKSGMLIVTNICRFVPFPQPSRLDNICRRNIISIKPAWDYLFKRPDLYIDKMTIFLRD